MSKRKRQEAVDADESGILDQALRIRVSRLKARLEQSQKSLVAALKLARGIERQKLGRRQKTASSDPHTLLRLREEVICLKQLDLTHTAKSQLFRHLFKTKRIREHPAFIEIYGPNPSVDSTGTRAGAEANVLARLFSAAPVRTAMREIVTTVFGILGLSANPKDDTQKGPSDHTQPSEKVAVEDHDFDGFSNSGSDQDETEVYIDSKNGPAEPRSSHNGLTAEMPSPSLSEADLSDDSSDTLDGQLTRSTNMKPVSKTAFLPSLSMGGYYSGSDSDEPPAFDDETAGTIQVRKNRRGQKARQQIAEKKYGAKAKHLQKQKDNHDRNAGWDAKRGAITGRGDAKRGFATRDRGKASHSHARGAQRHVETAPQKKRDDQGPIHPSWEAAKKRKMQSQAPAQFSGKKITFD
ncbi:hypothetical protein PV10_06629 [Exophiala mesophila]|uniref:Bud22 domain-containing protein n=1 Tax=Exophiala mesophila TaxID=212818 RepID=A0A0D1ZZ97_EXOME|nr:uncharacterized protein PV10_06629 [Exophiala mesophila]KIV92168.1 hypothetical protein PV10_06629 [Exophiala mesophila]